MTREERFCHLDHMSPRELEQRMRHAPKSVELRRRLMARLEYLDANFGPLSPLTQEELRAVLSSIEYKIHRGWKISSVTQLQVQRSDCLRLLLRRQLEDMAAC